MSSIKKAAPKPQPKAALKPQPKAVAPKQDEMPESLRLEMESAEQDRRNQQGYDNYMRTEKRKQMGEVFEKGGCVKKYAKGGTCRGGGAATKGTKFRGVM